MQTFFVNGNVIVVSYMDKNDLIIKNYLEFIDQKIHTPNKNIGQTVLSVPVQLFQRYFQNSYPFSAFSLGTFFPEISFNL